MTSNREKSRAAALAIGKTNTSLSTSLSRRGLWAGPPEVVHLERLLQPVTRQLALVELPARVVREHVDPRIGIQQLPGQPAHPRQVLEAGEVVWRVEPCRDGPRLLRRTADEDDTVTASDELTGCRGPDPVAGSRYDDGAHGVSCHTCGECRRIIDAGDFSSVAPSGRT